MEEVERPRVDLLGLGHGRHGRRYQLGDLDPGAVQLRPQGGDRAVELVRAEEPRVTAEPARGDESAKGVPALPHLPRDYSAVRFAHLIEYNKRIQTVP